MVPEILPRHKAVCHAEYIMLKECETWHVWKGLSDTPSPEFIRCLYESTLLSKEEAMWRIWANRPCKVSPTPYCWAWCKFPFLSCLALHCSLFIKPSIKNTLVLLFTSRLGQMNKWILLLINLLLQGSLLMNYDKRKSFPSSTVAVSVGMGVNWRSLENYKPRGFLLLT